MTIQEVLDKFIHAKMLAGLTEKSLSSYKQHIGVFIKYIGSELALVCLSREEIDNYIESLFQRGISRATISSYIRDTKIFLKWLEHEYGVDVCAKSIIVPKMPKKMLKIYSTEDIALIFKHIVAENEWLTLRNKCMIALMLDSGLRQCEICRLKHDDVDFNANTMLLHGKGNKDRLVPLGKLSKMFMSQYLAICPHSSDYVFVGRRGDLVTGNTLKKLVHKISKKLPFPFSCHILRHNFATNYCLDQYEQNGKIDIYSLKALMGHENIETTEGYLHIVSEILAIRQHISHLDKIRTQIA